MCNSVSTPHTSTVIKRLTKTIRKTDSRVRQTRKGLLSFLSLHANPSSIPFCYSATVVSDGGHILWRTGLCCLRILHRWHIRPFGHIWVVSWHATMSSLVPHIKWGIWTRWTRSFSEELHYYIKYWKPLNWDKYVSSSLNFTRRVRTEQRARDVAEQCQGCTEVSYDKTFSQISRQSKQIITSKKCQKE